MTSRQLLNRFVAAAAIALLPHWSARADDTEIYLNAGTGVSGDALVMFVLDLRPNVINSTVCTTGTYCTELYDQGYLDIDPAAATVHFGDLLGAVLKKVFAALPASGVKVGLSLNHYNKNNCEGPGHASDPGCSNGAFVAQRFVPLNQSCIIPILNGCTDSDGDGSCDGQEYVDRDGDGTAETLLIDYSVASCLAPADPAIGGATGRVPTYDYAEHSYQLREVYLELFRYLTGQTVYNGHNANIDFVPPSSYPGFPDTRQWLPWDADAQQNPSTYASPLTTGCSKVFVINVMFGVNQVEADSDTAVEAAEAAEGMGITLKGGGDTKTAQVIRYMNRRDLSELGSVPTGAGVDFDPDGDLAGDQNVISYFIVKTEKVTDITNAGFAAAGGTGTPYPLDIDDPRALEELFNSIFSEILGISTTFVSASVPVNVINKANSLENVYFGIFEPESTAQWTGNLKRLELRVNSADQLQVVDTTVTEAISVTDGKIKHSALTFWTNALGWDVQTADPDKNEIVGRDGRSVYRGGGGQRIPGFLSGNDAGVPSDENSDGLRLVFTEPASYTPGTPTTLMDLDAGSASTAAEYLWDYMKTSIQGTGNETDWLSADPLHQAAAVDLLKFARGIDVFDQDLDGDTAEARHWIMGDALHSQPLPLNYGLRPGYSATNQDIRIFLAGNDGIMHSFRNALPDGTPDGSERWAFIPRELLGNLKTLADNANQSMAGTVIKNPYGLDGKASVYVKDVNLNDANSLGDEAGDTVRLYFGMRRGGRSYYALDVTDPDTPKFLWRVTKTNDGSAMDELGLTFARPRIGKLDWGAGPKPVLFVGGGYDPDKDDYVFDSAAGASAGDDDEGRTVLILDAENGQVVWSARESAASDDSGRMVDSIPSEVSIFDLDADGVVDTFYVGDTGGRLWRGSLAGTSPGAWTIEMVFEDGRHVSGAGASDDRRFFHRPDAVRFEQGRIAVLIGSGNRAHPSYTSVRERFYQVRDDGSSTYDLSSLENLTSTSTCTNDCTDGWYMNLGTYPDGEKLLASPLTFLGTVYFSTYVPGGGASASCGPAEGVGKTYAIRIDDASARFDMNGNSTLEAVTDRSEETGYGIPSDPVFISLDKNYYITPSNLTPKEPFRSALNAKNVSRSYWYEIDR